MHWYEDLEKAAVHSDIVSLDKKRYIPPCWSTDTTSEHPASANSHNSFLTQARKQLMNVFNAGAWIPTNTNFHNEGGKHYEALLTHMH